MAKNVKNMMLYKIESIFKRPLPVITFFPDVIPFRFDVHSDAPQCDQKCDCAPCITIQ